MTQFENFTKDLIFQIESHITRCQNLSILMYVADRNTPSLIEAINRYVATKELWGETDLTSYSTFDVARQQLYLKYNVLLEWFQKPAAMPGYNHVSVATHGYSHVMFDLDFNKGDPLAPEDV